MLEMTSQYDPNTRPFLQRSNNCNVWVSFYNFGGQKVWQTDISPNFGVVIKINEKRPSNVLVSQDPPAINFAFFAREEKASTRSTNNNKITLRKNFYDAIPYLLSYTRVITLVLQLKCSQP